MTFPCFAEVAADVVAVRRHWAFDPLDSADRRSLRGRGRREHRPNPPGDSPARRDQGVRKRSPGPLAPPCRCASRLSLSTPTSLALEGSRKQFEVPYLQEPEERRSARVLFDWCWLRGPAWGVGDSRTPCCPRTRLPEMTADDGQPFLGRTACDRARSKPPPPSTRGRTLRRFPALRM